MCKLLEIHKCRTTPLQSDGMVERMNRTVQDMLSKYIKTPQRDWDVHLDFLVMAYNSTPHESTGITPHRMVYGSEMRYPLDIITMQINDEEVQFESQYVQNLKNELVKLMNRLERI